MRFLLLPFMLHHLCSWAQVPSTPERGAATTELAPGILLERAANGVWTLEHWEEGDLVRRDQWAAQHIDATSLDLSTANGQLTLSCLPEHPRCVRSTLFTQDMERTSSALRASVPPEHLAALEDALRRALQEQDLRTAETQAPIMRNRATLDSRP